MTTICAGGGESFASSAGHAVWQAISAAAEAIDNVLCTRITYPARTGIRYSPYERCSHRSLENGE
jgi:hypothetical protein